MKQIALIMAIAIGAFCCAFGESELENPVTVTRLTDHLYNITCIGGQEYNLPPYSSNVIASVGPDGILLIDAGFASSSAALKDIIKNLGNGQLKKIINTHYHGDHTSGNQIFKDGADIMAHRNVIVALSGNYLNLPGQPSPNQPKAAFDDLLKIQFNGEEIQIVHTPNCHTSGDAYAYFPESKVVAAGDLFFPDEIPYIDLRGGGSVKGYLAQVKAFIDDFPDDIIFIASHGRQYTKDDLREYHNMLTETVRLIREAVENGKTLEEMIAENLLVDWQKWNGNFATTTLGAWITTVNTELAAGDNPVVSICEPLTKTLVKSNAQDAIKQYHLLKKTDSSVYDFGENQLNMLGYQLMMRDRLDDALEIFKLNVEVYPEASNAYDSYGEALMAKGDTVQSIVNYEKSLELNPDNTNAVEMLKKLRAGE